MRFGYVLLGLVTLSSLHISSANVVGHTHARCDASSWGAGGQCSNGLAGVQTEDVCCDEACGTCGGNGCSARPGGSSNCCVGIITRGGMMCSDTMEAPCIVEAPEVCNNGLPGIQSGNVCCDPGCGECGGPGCGRRPGGGAACCSGTITNMGMMCSATLAAPCIIDDEVVCSNGVHGVELDGSCCEAQCGTCGGSGCSRRPGGRDACCSNVIQNTEIYCDDTPVAPCII